MTAVDLEFPRASSRRSAWTHSLKKLWDLFKTEALPKMQEDGSVKEWDIEFVEACILEFDAIDPVRASGSATTANMPHVRGVLGMLDVWFYDTHGMIQEWEAEMNSW